MVLPLLRWATVIDGQQELDGNEVREKCGKSTAVLLGGLIYRNDKSKNRNDKPIAGDFCGNIT